MAGRRETHRAPVIVVLAGFVLGLAVPGVGGAGPSGQSPLRQREAALGDRSHTVLLSLYSLDARLAQSRSHLASLEAQSASIRREQAEVARGKQIAHAAWQRSVDSLGAQLRTLYEQGQPDAIAVVFGATSIDDALTRIDQLQRSARISRETVADARAAQRTLAKLEHELAVRAAELQSLEAQARATTAALERTRAQRVAYLASLARQRAWTSRRIAQVDATAQRSAARSEVVTAQVAASPPSGASPPVAPAAPGQTLTVSSTGYALAGRTASGLPVGWGIVAVDPSVIPLGTRMTIPGYGEGVAADTGGAVHGMTIDLWFPTEAQAMAWGRRTVVITLH